MYLLKIKGVNRMPDFIQLRDDDFTLLGYFRADRVHHLEAIVQHQIPIEELTALVDRLPYGQLYPFDPNTSA